MNKKFNVIVDDTREQQFQKEIKSIEKKLNKIDGAMEIKEVGKNVIVDDTYTVNREYEITLSIDLQIPDYRLVAVNKLNIDKYIYIQIDNTIQVPDTIKTTYTCQHCNTNRKRKMYYVFYNEIEGKFIVVGSSCCKLYFGIDVEKKLKKYQSIINYCEGLQDNSKIKIHKIKVVDVIEKILVFDITENTTTLKYSDYKNNLKRFVNQFEAFPDMVEYLQYNKEDINKKAIEIKDYILNMDNPENNEYLNNLKDIFKWVTNSVVLEDNKTYTIKGTIKAHEEYKETKQNVLTRCKVKDYEKNLILNCNDGQELLFLFDKYNKSKDLRLLIYDRLIQLIGDNKEGHWAVWSMEDIVLQYKEKYKDVEIIEKYIKENK